MKAPLSLLAAVALLAACSKPADTPVPAAAPAPTAAAQPGQAGVAWHRAASDADVDAAFALARRENKPVFVYGGANWCPPCNQVKATLFNRQDFIERSRAFVPVYIDGDTPGAQKLGARFTVRGYPTMVLFHADGTELTRLPGEVDPAMYTQVLTLGMSAQRPVKEVLADARSGGARLTPGDWKLLAFKEVSDHAARADREITDGYERQAVITAAAHLLARAGLAEESDQLLLANLAKSHSPYYLMSQLASNARRRGDKAEALRWSKEAFRQAEGPATRLQWGAGHVDALIELAPRDEARIERAVQQLLDEAAAQPDAFYERSARSLQRVGRRLLAWNQDRSHAAVLQRLQARLDDVCDALPADAAPRRVCEGLLRSAGDGGKAG